MFGRPFPDESKQKEICDLYTSGLRLEEVQERTGWCVTTIQKILTRNGVPARKRGTRLGTGKIQLIDDSALVSFKKQWDKLESTVKGTIAETQVATRLSELGFDVWQPFCQNHKTDFLIALKSRFVKAQVKCATYDIKTKSFRANVTRHRRNGQVTQYSVEDVDFFIAYCCGFDSPVFYVVPAAKVLERADMKFYPQRKRGFTDRAVDWEMFKNAFDLIR